MADKYYTNKELKEMGFAGVGKKVIVSKTCVFYHPEQIWIEDHVLIDDFVVISGNVHIGKHVHISSHCELYAGDSLIELGDYAGLSSGVSVYALSDDYVGSFMNNPTCPIRYRNITEAPVHIGRFVGVGMHCVIMPGVTIGEGCTFGAMCMISKPVYEPWGIYVLPGRRIGEREKNVIDMAKELEQLETPRKAKE